MRRRQEDTGTASGLSGHWGAVDGFWHMVVMGAGAGRKEVVVGLLFFDLDHEDR